MNLKSIIKNMIYSFFIIVTSILASMCIFTLIFNPEALFTLTDLLGIFITALITTSTTFIFYSKKELTKKQMRIRTIIHIVVLLAICLFLSQIFGWANFKNHIETFLFVLSVFGTYVLIYIFSEYRDRKLSDKLNESIKERYKE